MKIKFSQNYYIVSIVDQECIRSTYMLQYLNQLNKSLFRNLISWFVPGQILYNTSKLLKILIHPKVSLNFMPSQTNKLFYSDPKNERDRASYRFFMQYIRSLGFESTKLLRFLTGSDIIIIENIEVSFSAMEGLARRPIANTCAPMLELPNSYRNF